MKFNDNEIVAAARTTAHAAHGNQTRRDGSPYINHPARVALRVEQLGGDPDEVAAAWLHDVLEDTAWTAEDLIKDGLPQRVVEIVWTLTKRAGTSYDEYLSTVNMSQSARLVKVADLIDNLSDTATLPHKLLAKYGRALGFLGEQLVRNPRALKP